MKEIDRQIENLANGLYEHVRELVRYRSVQGPAQAGMPFGKDVHACLERALSIAQSMGFNTRMMDGYCGYAEYGVGEGYICVLGHLDVVPEGDGWDYPPYGAEIHENVIYGRGTMDDKGPIMAALYGLKAIKDAGLPIKRRIRVLFGANEESGFGDMPYYVAHEKAPVCGFTPDGEFPVIYSEKGLLFGELNKKFAIGSTNIISIEGGTAPNVVPALCKAVLALDYSFVSEKLGEFIRQTGYKITCEPAPEGVLLMSEGLAAHGSKPHLGSNAITHLLAFLGTLPVTGEGAESIRLFNRLIGMETDGSSLDMRLTDEAGNLTLNLGMIRMDIRGISVTVDIRYPGKYTEAQIIDMLQKKFSTEGYGYKMKIGMPAVYFPKDHFLIDTLMNIYVQYTGKHTEPLAIGGGTYAKTVPNIVAFGPLLPGRKDFNHMANEHIALNELLLLAKIYGNAMYELAK